MVLGGATPVGSGRVPRLDPLSLPLRFTTRDEAADGRVRQVELDNECVVVRRAVRGMRMKLRLPVPAFIGVALGLIPANGKRPDLLEVRLAHRDRALSIPLFVASDSEDIIAEWQLWARVLKRPLLIAYADGTYRDPFPRIGEVRVGLTTQRRRRRNTIRQRRGFFPLRRRQVRFPDRPAIYRGEREIIARS